jgi:hypothetical protein
MHISLCPGVAISVGYYRRPKIVSERKTGFCFLYSRPHHGHNSPLPNCLPRSQFLSDLDLVSCKIYPPPLTNMLGTFESPSSRRLSLEIDRMANNTLIPPFLPPPDQIAPPEVNSCPFWGWQRNKIEVFSVLWSISRGRQRDDGDLRKGGHSGLGLDVGTYQRRLDVSTDRRT